MGSSSGRHVAKWEVLLRDMSRNGKLFWAFGQRIFREMKDLGISRRFHVFFKRPSKKSREIQNCLSERPIEHPISRHVAH